MIPAFHSVPQRPPRDPALSQGDYPLQQRQGPGHNASGGVKARPTLIGTKEKDGNELNCQPPKSVCYKTPAT